MKTQTTTLLAPLSSREIKHLTTEVKETLATRFQSDVKTFAAVDLWNIQRRRKSFGIRRNFA